MQTTPLAAGQSIPSRLQPPSSLHAIDWTSGASLASPVRRSAKFGVGARICSTRASFLRTLLPRVSAPETPPQNRPASRELRGGRAWCSSSVVLLGSFVVLAEAFLADVDHLLRRCRRLLREHFSDDHGIGIDSIHDPP